MKKPNTLILALTVALPVMGMTLISPSLLQIKSNLNITFSNTQLVLSMYFFSLAVGQLISGPLSDRFGRKPIIILGTLIYTIAAFFCFLSTKIDQLIISRIFQGLGAAACLSVGRTIISDSYERSKAAEKLSSITAIMVTIPILCFIFGGIITDTYGWRINFILLSLVSFLLFLSMIFFLNETNINKTLKINLYLSLFTYFNLFKNRIFLCFTFATGMQTAMFFSMNGFMPYEYQRLGLSLTEFGIWFSLTSLGYIFGNVVNSKITSKIGLEKMCVYGTNLSLIIIFLMVIINYFNFQTVIGLSLLCACFGFSNGLVVANGMIGAINATRVNQGSASGLMGSMQVGFGAFFGFLIIFFGGAENFYISLLGMIIMCLISIFASLLNSKNMQVKSNIKFK